MDLTLPKWYPITFLIDQWFGTWISTVAHAGWEINVAKEGRMCENPPSRCFKDNYNHSSRLHTNYNFIQHQIWEGNQHILRWGFSILFYSIPFHHLLCSCFDWLSNKSLLTIQKSMVLSTIVRNFIYRNFLYQRNVRMFSTFVFFLRYYQKKLKENKFIF